MRFHSKSGLLLGTMLAALAINPALAAEAADDQTGGEAILVEATKIAHDVVERFREIAGDGPEITASCGIATSPPIGATPAAMMAAGDSALYRAKREGRDGVAVASTTITPDGPGDGFRERSLAHRGHPKDRGSVTGEVVTDPPPRRMPPGT